MNRPINERWQHTSVHECGEGLSSTLGGLVDSSLGSSSDDSSKGDEARSSTIDSGEPSSASGYTGEASGGADADADADTRGGGGTGGGAER